MNGGVSSAPDAACGDRAGGLGNGERGDFGGATRRLKALQLATPSVNKWEAPAVQGKPPLPR